MKSLIILLCSVLLGLTLNAQEPNLNVSITKQLEQINALDLTGTTSYLQEVGCFDHETYEWVDSLGTFFKTSIGKTTIDLSGGYYTIDATLQAYDVNNSNYVNAIKVVTYGHDFNFSGETQDSLNVYVWDDSLAMDYVLFTKILYSYENNLLKKEVTYINYDALGIPLGVVKSNESDYVYDGSNYLVGINSKGLDLFTLQLIPSDSIVYINNSSGVALEEISYDYVMNSFVKSDKETYTYNSSGLLESTNNAEWLNDSWILYSRDTYQYDAQNRQNYNLSESTMDNGTSWAFEIRDSAHFDLNFAFSFPNRTASQKYDRTQWKYDSYTVYYVCGTSAIHDLKAIQLNAWFDGEELVLQLPPNIEKAHWDMQLIDIAGRLIFQKADADLTEHHLVPQLPSGIYFLSIKNDDSMGVAKLIK